jgi:glycine oxidase
MAEITIIGAGIIGMLSARELLAQGYRVRIIERQALGQEASLAGGGIISPLYPWRYDDVITCLASWAQDTYPHLAQQLFEETGIDSEFSPCGMYLLDSRESDQALAWAKRNHRAITMVSREQACHAEPALSADFEQALHLPYIGHIRNPRLLAALQQSLRNNSACEIVEYQPVVELQKRGARISVVVTDQQRFDVDTVLLTAGAWTGLLAESLGIKLPIEPIKGQMLVFEPRPKLLSSMVMHDGRYLIPRRDGRIIVGSTLEYTGFDQATSEQARGELLAAACRMLPALAEVPIAHHWAGLRPGSPLGVPFIGACPDLDNLFVNAGHFRNGLVLAPAAVRLVVNLMLGQVPIVDPAPYALDREVVNAAPV